MLSSAPQRTESEDAPDVITRRIVTRRILIGAGAAARFILPAGFLAEATGAGAAVPARAHQAPPHQAPHRPRNGAPPRAAAPLPLVMLDPGHGGKDPGAIGVSGTYEKHIALATAQELQHQLQATGRYRVELTRTRDIFIPLRHRVEIAQGKGAALFVSMHADAIDDPGVRGASVYTLSDGASDAQTAALARRENAADRFGMPDFHDTPPEVSRILASLVRQETRRGSARMSHAVVNALGQDVGLLQNPARHAGFMVLKAPDIPSVLVEMGFMSNRTDEAALRRPDHRARVATAMKRAVEAWFASTANHMGSIATPDHQGPEIGGPRAQG